MEFGFAPVQSRPRFDEMQAQARLAEELGYAALWAHEHHSQGMMYPDPLMTLAALAPLTRRIGLGTNMLLLPIHHPVRVAQAAAMLDVLSEGRARLGVANGYSAHDLRAFGMTGRHRGHRLDSGLQLIRDLWSGEPVTARGDDFDLEGFELFPRPVQPGGPPIYVGGHAEVAVRRAARLGDHYLISTTQVASEIPGLVATYHAALAELGAAPRSPTLNRIVCVVDDAAKKQEAERFFARALIQLYEAWGHSNVTSLDEDARAHRTLCDEHFIIGEPSECTERVQSYAEMGVGHIACLMNFGGPDLAWVDRSMRLLAEQVMPKVS